MKQSAKSKYQHLKEHHQMLWCWLMITEEGALYLNIEMIIEVILVIQFSSANVERGFLTLRKNLRENRSAMSNERLN